MSDVQSAAAADLGHRWESGEPIAGLAREAGVSWQSLWGELHRRGFLPPSSAALRASRKPAGSPAAPQAPAPEPPARVVPKPGGRQHANFAKASVLARARMNLLLVGPAGCGKSVLAEQVAADLALPFSFISCSAGMSETHLLGKKDPATGAFLTTEFLRCYEEGGVFLFDELDAADSNVLLVINAALANGHVAVPNRSDRPIARRHPDFVCVAAANTFGTGSDRQYVGRSQLDESTLDRFRIGQIFMGYDAGIEKAACPDDELRERLQGYRGRVLSARLRRIVSTRFLANAYAVKQAGLSDEDIDAALFAGWSDDEVRKVRGS